MLDTPEREAVRGIVTSWELKGRAEGQRLILERQLTRKFGVLPDAVIARLPQLSSSQLTALAEALLDFTTVSDMERWLASPPPPVNEDDDEGEDEDDQADEE